MTRRRYEQRIILYPPRSTWQLIKFVKSVLVLLLRDIKVGQIDEIKMTITPLEPDDPLGPGWDVNSEATVRE